MREDEDPNGEELRPANDDAIVVKLDPRILRIAQAVGRQLARELASPPAAANDQDHSAIG
jgi:hypothetical protein